MIVRELVTLLAFDTNADGAREAERVIDRVENRASEAANTIGSTFRNMFAGVAALFAGQALMAGFRALTDASDQITTAMNQLNAAMEGDERGALATFERIYGGARETGIAVTSTTQAFLRFAPAMREAGFGASETVSMLEGLQKGLLAAGTDAQASGETIRQMGQAISQGKLNDDELTNFLENASPTMIKAFAEALGTTTDKLKEMGSEGELTNDKILPALIKTAQVAAEQFGNMEVTVALANARFRVVMTRFLGELTKAIGLERVLIGWTTRLADSVEGLRRGLPALQALIRELGGLERILQVVALSLAVGTAAWLAYNRAALVAAIRTVAAFAPWVLGGIAVAAVAAMIMDFVEWVGGEDVDTLFRRWFGPFADIQAQYQPQIDALRTAWDNFKGAVGDAYVRLSADGEVFWPVLMQYLRTLWETMDGVGKFIGQTMRTLVTAFQTDWEELKVVIEAFKAGWQGARDLFAQIAAFIGTTLDFMVQRFVSGFGTIVGWIDRAKEAFRSWLGMEAGGAQTPNGVQRQGFGPMRRGTLAPGDGPVGDEAFRADMRDILSFGAGNAAPMAGAIARGADRTVNAPQSNTFHQSIAVTATGINPAEVSAATSQGVTRANEGAASALREAQVNMPLTEAPAQ